MKGYKKQCSPNKRHVPATVNSESNKKMFNMYFFIPFRKSF